ncbi:MAG: hypothetical protein ACXVB4_19255 [Pseudobdellovibrionaceae bacterium]
MMKRLAVLFFAFAFALTMGSGYAFAAMSNMSKSDKTAQATTSKEETITGKVMDGKIVADNGKEYFVENNAKGKELFKDHMGHMVEVKGKVFEKDGKQMIKLSSIKHLSNG